ncbi:unnamed protein product [Durusdinium trenchii]|uniref:Helicase-associated domain-containing protein n=1 Tax=Durusdinium trenchii TaxID=1381693 RepID=A0ABP0SNV0_9DINO
MAQRRRRRHLLLGLVGVLGAMRLMAERMEVGFAGWKMDQMGLGPGALLRLRSCGRTGGSLVPHAATAEASTVSRPWETRFRELEAFVEEHERLPRRFRADEAETQLGFWLNSQGKRVTSQQIPSRQLEKLRTARSDLIRRRAEGWITGDPDGCFEENCRELREYIEMNGELPRCTPSESDSSAFRLATWLRNLRANGARAMPERRKMLEEVHPLVKELLQEWDDSPLKINRVKWEEDLEKVLDIVEQHGRLPKAKTEKPEYHWLWRQLRRLDTLPPELEKRLRGSHPLVAEAARRSEQKAKGTKA